MYYIKLTKLSVLLLLFIFFSSNISALKAQTVDTTKKAIKIEAKAKSANKVPSNHSATKQQIDSELQSKFKKELDKARRKEITPIINDLLHPSQERREITLDGIKRLPDPRLIGTLTKILKTDQVPTVRKDAAIALFSIAKYESKYKADVIPTLQNALNDESITVKYAISKLLIEFGSSEESIFELSKIFKKEYTIFQKDIDEWINKEVCRPDLPYNKQKEIAFNKKEMLPQRALDILVKVGNQQVKNILIDCIKSNDSWVSLNAISALKKLEQ